MLNDNLMSHLHECIFNLHSIISRKLSRPLYSLTPTILGSDLSAHAYGLTENKSDDLWAYFNEPHSRAIRLGPMQAASVPMAE